MPAINRLELTKINLLKRKKTKKQAIPNVPLIRTKEGIFLIGLNGRLTKVRRTRLRIIQREALIKSRSINHGARESLKTAKGLIKMKKGASPTDRSAHLKKDQTKKAAIVRKEALIKGHLTNGRTTAALRRTTVLTEMKKEVFPTDRNAHLKKDQTKREATGQKEALIKSHLTNAGTIEILRRRTVLTKTKKEVSPTDQNAHLKKEQMREAEIAPKGISGLMTVKKVV